MSEAPRDDLVRSVPFELERDDTGDGRTLEGYAAVFGEWTEINSWEGHFRERLLPGSFKKTLREAADRVRLQFDHGSHPLIGSIPIGAIQELREDDRGLFVRARLHDNWLIQPVRDAIQDGSIDGMSFRFSVPDNRDSWDESVDPPERSIREVSLKELGPVVWPAYESTTVGVRSAEIARTLIDDEDVRVEVARVLNLGVRPDIEGRSDAAEDSTSPEGDAARGTSDTPDGTSPDGDVADRDAPTVDDGHPSEPRLTDAQRKRKLAFVREHLSLIQGSQSDG